MIYLIHPYIALGMGRVVSRWLPELTTRTVWGLLVYFAVVITLSVAIHILIERRIIELGRLYLSRGRVPLPGKRLRQHKPDSGACATPRSAYLGTIRGLAEGSDL